MKRINLGTVTIHGSDQSVLKLLKEFTESAPADINNRQQTLGIKMLRDRSRVLEKLEAVDTAAAYVDVEDGDLEALKQVVNNVGYLISSPGYVKIIDAVEKAEAPPTVN